MEAVLDAATRPYVHHILLYHCMSNMSEWVGLSEPCFDRAQTSFSPMYQCVTRMIAGWAVGGEVHLPSLPSPSPSVSSLLRLLAPDPA